MINIILWVGFGWWVFAWMVSFIYVTTNKTAYALWQATGKKFKYGIIDVIGILSLIGLVVRYW